MVKAVGRKEIVKIFTTQAGKHAAQTDWIQIQTKPF
jgi:hypothetical protein